MRSGLLRHKAVVTVPSDEIGSDGSIENVDTVLGTFYTSVATKNAGEVGNNGKMVTFTMYTLQMRYNSTDLRGLVGNATIVINGVTPVLEVTSAHVVDERNRIIEITAEARI